MQEWQRKALEILPEMQDEILESDNPMQLWIEIGICFDGVYEEPRNESFIKRVYDYEDWCLTQEAGETVSEHLPTIVTMFWERIPCNKASREHMPRWFSLEHVLANQHFFKYYLTDEDFKGLVDLYSKSALKLER